MGLGVRYQVKDLDNQRVVEEIYKVIVHRFRIGDVDDPEIYAAQPIWEWQQTDAGKFVIENAIDVPTFQHQLDVATYGYQYVIIAELEKKKLAEFYMRWGKDGNSKS